MNRYLKALSLVTAIAGLYVPAVAVAQKSAGGVTGEARLHPGTWNAQRSSRSFARLRPTYRSAAPVIVRTEPAPSAVAQAPTVQRSFSYEPSQQAEITTPCPPSSVTVEPAPETAQQPTRTGRSFSYEPAIEPSTGPAVRTYRSFSYEPSMGGSYSSPRMQSSQPSRSSGTPRYLLPKTDPQKYRN